MKKEKEDKVKAKQEAKRSINKPKPMLIERSQQQSPLNKSESMNTLISVKSIEALPNLRNDADLNQEIEILMQ